MKRRSFLVSLIGLVLSIVSVLVIAGHANANTIYVYNHDPNDGFDNNVEAWIWKKLGLVDNHGRPNIAEENKIKNSEDPNEVVGYSSSDGSKKAYNVNSSFTTAEAWQEVDPNGKFIIAKHGLSHTEPNGVRHLGGAIQLDKGYPYNGFGDGTGAGYASGPNQPGEYELPDHNSPKGNFLNEASDSNGITVDLNGCYTDSDPNLEEGDTSVTDSIEGPNGPGGVGEVIGHKGLVDAKVIFGTLSSKQVTQDTKNAVFEGLRAAAREDDYPPPDKNGNQGPTTNADVFEWISKLPAATRYDKIQDIIDDIITGEGLPEGSMVLVLDYDKVPRDPNDSANRSNRSASSGGHSQCPQQVSSGGGTLECPYWGISDSPAFLTVEPNSINSPAIFQINMLAEVPSSIERYSQASGIYQFKQISGGEIVEPVTIKLRFSSDPNYSIPVRYDQNAGEWRAIAGGDYTLDEENRLALIRSMDLGTYAIFEPFRSQADFDGDGKVTFSDVSYLSSSWQSCTNPNEAGCVRGEMPQEHYILPRREVVIVVDGYLGEWADAEWIDLDVVYDGEPSDVQAAQFALRWDANAVYLAVKVQDENHYFGAYSGRYNQDYLEIYTQGTAMNYEYGPFTAPSDPNFVDGQTYMIGTDGLGGRWAAWRDQVDPNMPTDCGDTSALEYAVNVRENWIEYEVKIVQYDLYNGFPDGTGGTSEETSLEDGHVVTFDVAVVSKAGSAAGGMLTENDRVGKHFNQDGIALTEYLLIPQECGLWGYSPYDLDYDCRVGLSDLWIQCEDWLYNMNEHSELLK